MRYLLSLATAIFFILAADAQTKIPLINSGDVIERGKVLYDSGKYDEAIKLYQTIPARDTNYVNMLGELALTYIALKKPEQAIETCTQALRDRSAHRNHILRSLAIALDHAGQYDRSVETFQKGIADYPMDYAFMYNLGITYYNHKEYAKAADCFFKTLAIKPFHGGSHLNLARIAIGQGRKTHAMMAMGVYLSIYANDNDRLVSMDKFLSNQLPQEEGTIEGFDVNTCEKLDQIIRAKIATEANFKTSMPLRAPVVQQYEMFFQQLAMIQDKGDDRWVTYYLPFYKGVSEQKYADPFLYTVLTSTNNDDIRKWKKKNNKIHDAYLDFASAKLKETRVLVNAPMFGFEKPVKGWYNDDGNLDALGEQVGEKKSGRWIYFFNNYEKSTEGTYDDKGEKVGIWKYYFDNGALQSVVDMGTGEYTYYFASGKKDKHYFFRDEGVQGAVEIYHPTGELKEKSNYKNGKRHGKIEVFYPSGNLDIVYNYVDGALEGETLSYFESGVLFSKTIYKAGAMNGPYLQYFANGKLRSTGTYVNDGGEGEWKYYYINGQLEKVGNYKNDQPVGEWKFNLKDGSPSSVSHYDQGGKLDGEQISYENGKQFFVNTFKGGLLVNVNYFDASGKSIGSFGNDKGNFKGKTFYTTGELLSEGNYKAGEVDGLWKIYFRTGQIQGEQTYSKGKKNGKGIAYFKNGNLNVVANYVDGAYDGSYQDFYEHGQVKQEGWFQQDQRQQQWISYHANGEVESDMYYVNNELSGEYIDYHSDGKMTRKLNYVEGKIMDVALFGNDEKDIVMKKSTDGSKHIFEAHYPNGGLKHKVTIQGGVYSGKVEGRFVDGKEMYAYNFLGGNRHGHYAYTTVDGILLTSGDYLNGDRFGRWRYMNEVGGKESEGMIYNDLLDSVWTYYHFNGKISVSGAFVDDERDGVTTYYGPDGNPIYQKNFEGGDLLAYRGLNANQEFGEWKKYTGNDAITFYYPSGKKAFEEKHEKGMINGVRKLYYPDGGIFQEFSFKDGNYEGPFVVYFENGKIQMKGVYKWDDLDGLMEIYNEDGTRRKSITYQLGVKDGKTILYNKGVKIKEYDFWNGITK